MMNSLKYFLIIIPTALLSGCLMGPDYHRPNIPVPAAYKENKNTQWQSAKPADLSHRGQWWAVFHSQKLNTLEAALNANNQNIMASKAQYRQARALVDEARASFFPTLSLASSTQRQQTGGGNSGLSSVITNTENQSSLNASWELDIWGSARRNVESSLAAAQASKAQLAAMQLSMQASLAQYYFELQGVDSDYQLLNNTVSANKKILQLTENRFHQGVGSMVDVVQARSQLENSQALLINLGINRGQYEHAIAALIGKAPADLTLQIHPLTTTPPLIPVSLPSELLQRRPDIAAAERAVAQANAQIGVAIAAYFPTLSLTAAMGATAISSFYSSPIYNWSFGPSLAETIFDAGLRVAVTKAASANYDATVAQYRQSVLTAFQDVEDNLVSLHVLKSQAIVQNQAANDARLSLQLTRNQYQAGTADYSNVLAAQINAYNAEKSAIDIKTLRMTSTVGLIKALGGGWDGDLSN